MPRSSCMLRMAGLVAACSIGWGTQSLGQTEPRNWAGMDRDPTLASPSTPVAQGDTPPCTAFDALGHGAGGILAVISDARFFPPAFPNGARGAERFIFPSTGTVTQLQWVGYYRGFNGTAFSQCTNSVEPDNFTVRLVGDVDGLPDDNNVLFQYLQPSNPALLAREELGIVIGGRVLILYTLTFSPPLQITNTAPKHLIIFNRTLAGNCAWLWRSAPAGDMTSTYDDEFDTWDDMDEQDFDMAYCFGDLVGPTPSVRLDRLGPVDVDTGCCNFVYTVRNLNPPGGGALSTFFLALNKGTGEAACENLASISPPTGFTASFCEPWTNGRAVIRFSGGSLPAQAETFGQIRTTVNGDNPIMVTVREPVTNNPVVETIGADEIRGWASHTNPMALCGTGLFGPQVGQEGDWSAGAPGACAIEPVPSLTAGAKWVLMAFLVGGGVLIVGRSRRPMAA